jgi:hypothetical protein
MKIRNVSVLTSVHRVTSQNTAIFNVNTIETSDLDKQGFPRKFTETALTATVSGFGGLGVSVLASGTQVRGFKPDF